MRRQKSVLNIWNFRYGSTLKQAYHNVEIIMRLGRMPPWLWGPSLQPVKSISKSGNDEYTPYNRMIGIEFLDWKKQKKQKKTGKQNNW